MPKVSKSYQQMSDQLNELLDWFESDDVNLEEAVSKYEEAVKLIDEIEKYLKTAENTIRNITKRSKA